MGGDSPSGSDPTLNDTLAQPGGPSRPAELSARTVAYRLGAVLGKGGMGEVVAATDGRLGREVALKRMRTTAPTKEELARFLREARIQALLDHPAIVPVYELGTDGEGFPYFTMKKLAGTTLAQLLTQAPTQQRLLRALIDVCLAVARAHDKDIVHRDLKPANIILGDYGEVYVLDWGIARMIGDTEEARKDALLVSSTSGTRSGQILGTPGYMAPEQARGLDVGPKADVYSLGAILFEILARQPLHPKGTAGLASTLEKHSGSPAQRTSGVAPELDELCSEALAEDVDARPTARELADRLQHFLDGDRDIERRRVMAAKLVVQGRAALQGGERADAVRLGGRAIALDPTNEDAGGLVMSLVTEPPETVPAEVEALVHDSEVAATRARSRRAFFPMMAFFVMTPFFFLIEVAHWAPLIGVYLSIGVIAAIAYVNWRVRPLPFVLWLAANIVMLTVFTRLSGPFVLTPVLICSVMMSGSAQPWIADRRWSIIAIAATVVVAPFVLEALGVFTRSWDATEHGVVSHGTVFLRGSGNVWPLFAANFLIVLLVSIYAFAINRDRRAAQRQLIIQSWHLRQLLPREATQRTPAV